MLQQRAYTYDGNMEQRLTDKQSYLIGLIGGLLLFSGKFNATPQYIWIFASMMLLVCAAHFKLVYFIALELILIAGHLAILLGLGNYLQMSLPILLCFQLIVYYIISDYWRDFFVIPGVIGIAILSIGFAQEESIYFLTGSILIATYAFAEARNKPAALIWAYINTLFTIESLYYLLFF